VERASRLLVLVSTAAAFLSYLWLLDWIEGLQIAGLVLAVCGAVIARADFDIAVGALAGLAFLTPALVPQLLGTQDFHGLMLWLAPATGVLLARADWRAWSVPAAWAWPLATWALIVAATWPIIVTRELDLSMIAATTLDTPNGIAAPAPRLTAGWVAHSVLSQLLGLLWFDLLWRQYGRARLVDAERSVLRPLLAGIAIGALVAIYQGVIDLSFLNGGIWPNLRRAPGLMLDANAFAIGAALAAPLAIAMAWRRGWSLQVGIVLFAVIATGMWFGGSRTALLALVAGTIGTGISAADRKGAWHSSYVPIGLLLGAAVLILAMFLAPRGGNSPSPLQRVFDRLPTPDRTSISQFLNEMWGRFGYGPAAVQMIREHPVSGVGVASFHILGADYIYRAERRVLPADNAQNWWRHYLAELGLVGAIAPFICSFLLLRLFWSGHASGAHRDALTVVRGVIAGLGTASMLGVPVQHPAVWFLAASVIFWGTALQDVVGSDAPRVRAAVNNFGWLVTTAVVGVSAAGQIRSASGDLRVPVRAQQTGFSYLYGLTPEASRQFGEVRRAAGRAVGVVPAQRPWLELIVWAPHATAAAPVSVDVEVNGRTALATRFSSPSPLVRYVALGSSAFVRLEFVTVPTDDRGRGVNLAYRWHSTPPVDAADDQIVR
jgi:hypothetical protein